MIEAAAIAIQVRGFCKRIQERQEIANYINNMSCEKCPHSTPQASLLEQLFALQFAFHPIVLFYKYLENQGSINNERRY